MGDKKTLIYDSAKEIFSLKGFKDTNISDITKMAGMAVGTFYNYYPSKEKLFMDIYVDENIKLKKSFIQSMNPEEDPLTIIKKILQMNLVGMKANPILREWYNKDVFDKIERTFREENGIQAVDFIYDDFLEDIKQWQIQGKIRSDIDSKMIMMIFVAIINVDTHKEEIGLEYFPQLMEYLTELIFKGLTDCSKT